MQFRVLGPIEVLTDTGAGVPLGGGRERLVLARLLLGADRLVPSEVLIDSLWEDPPPTAKQQLQNLIAGLRRRLSPHDAQLVVTRPFGYELRMGRHSLDLVTFRRLVADARSRRHQPTGGDSAGGVLDLLSTAVGLWRGAPLSDAAPATTDTDTAALTRALTEERIAAVDLLIEALAHEGEHDEVLAVAATHLAEDPWNERLHEHRLRALAATGRRAEAGEAFLALRRQLRDELGVEPGKALAELHLKILDGADLVAVPERRRPVPRELPALAWTLVGREALHTRVLDRLLGRADQPSEGAPAIVVLVGVGGVGKTSLAIAAAHAATDDYPDGTLYAALGDGHGGGADGHDVLGRFLRALGVEPSAVPTDPQERVALYRSTIAGKRVLVVLDNALSEVQVRHLLPASSGSAAIVTSRKKLAGLAGVARETVPPLAPEDGARLVAALAGRDYPRPVGGDDESALIDHIAALCGQLPLALCVAGAKLATNDSLDLTELRDRLAQQHSRLDELSAGDVDVRASIEMSVTDLPPDAAQLFRRLAVCSVSDWPGWVPGVLLGVLLGVGHGPGEADPEPVVAERAARRALDVLIDRHLVEPLGRDAAGQPRFRMHRLVTELADEHLASHEPRTEPALVHALVSAWLRLAQAADAVLDPSVRDDLQRDPGTFPGAAQATALPSAWFEHERVNLVAAVAAAVTLDERELAASLALAVRTFLTIRAYDAEHERILRLALDDYPMTADQRLAAQLLAALFGVVAQHPARFGELGEIARRLLRAAQELDDPALEQRALSQLAWAAMALHHYDEALDWLEKAGEHADRHGDAGARVRADAHRGVVLRNIGLAAEGDPLIAAMVEESRRTGPRRAVSIWLATRAEGLVDLESFDEAEALAEEAADIARELHDEVGQANCHLVLARVQLGRGAIAEAEQELDLARTELDARAGAEGDADLMRLEIDVLAGHGAWDDAATRTRHLVARRRRTGHGLDLATDLVRLARIERSARRDGTTFAAEAAALLHELGLPAAAVRLPSSVYGPP